MKKHVTSSLITEPVTAEPLLTDADVMLSLMSSTDSIGYWRLDLPCGDLWWSPTVYRIHGLEVADGPVNVATAIRAYHPDDAKTVAWLVEQAVSKKVGYRFVMRMNRADGSLRLVESVASLALDDDGHLTRIFGFLRDVTDRYSLQDLADSRRNLVRSILANLPVPMAVLDRNMRYLDLSSAWLRYYGLEAREPLIGKHHYEVMPDLPAAFKRDNEKALSGQVVRSQLSLAPARKGISRSMSVILFPWLTVDKAVGGIIILLTPVGASAEHEPTLHEVAKLIDSDHGRATRRAAAS